MAITAEKRIDETKNVQVDCIKIYPDELRMYIDIGGKSNSYELTKAEYDSVVAIVTSRIAGIAGLSRISADSYDDAVSKKQATQAAELP